MNTAIKVENLSKIYRLGEIGTGTISRDMERWFKTRILKQEDPFLKIGETNDRTTKGTSDFVYSLQNINFEINQGDAVGIIGRNGAGKSTLLKILSRVTTPTTGKINIKGRVASLLEVGTGFHPELSGRENIYLNGAILGMRKREIDSKLEEIIDFSGVERYIDTPVKRYSSGMYVRLAFAVAAHLESEILIVDEVLAVGDAEFQKKCLGKMGEVSKGEGRTVLFVSHQMGMIQSLCNDCIYLENGLVSEFGNSTEVIKNYIQNESKVKSQFSNNIRLTTNGIDSQITYLFLCDEHGIMKNEFDVFEKRYLCVEVEINRKNNQFSLFYSIKKNGEIIICSHENDFQNNVFERRDVGNLQYKIELPNYLKAGDYSFENVGIGIPNNGAIHCLENILDFRIEEFSFDPSLKGFSKNRPGILIADGKYSQIR
jgi:lipopolysaccharide transport system ATP-binding protein